MRSLEVELRQTRLERNGRGVTLTEAGKRLLEHSRGILAQVKRARLDLEDHLGAATGRVGLALPPSVSRTQPKLAATLWIATPSQRPRGPLIEQCTELVRESLAELWA